MPNPFRRFSPTRLTRSVLIQALLLLSFFPANVRGEVSIIDDAGQSVTLAAPAARIVSLYAGLSECLAVLGLAGNIVGRTNSDNTVPASLPNVGTHIRPNPELIAAMAPDLAVQFEGRETAQPAENLRRLNIPVARFRISSFEELFSCLQRLGVLCAREEAAKAGVRNLRERLAKISVFAAQGRKPKIFFETRYPNLLGAGGGHIVNDIIAAAGGTNCLEAYPDRLVRISEEAVVLFDPDIYLVQRGDMNKNPSPPAGRAHFAHLAAVKNGFALMVEESLYSRAGPQSVAAAEDLSRVIAAWREKYGPGE
ncbi:MAG: ABC transporter substrate-binding protein [Desulfovibrio sp.]|jgi:iron complex transport system substrate-binding protein|nr:ABC transporter substrate-binding protein [Desulfovibrio sp.]